MIIGLTGKNGAGKTTVVEYLTQGGFIAYSLSDVIRDELKKRGREVTREHLIEMGRQLREAGGPPVLAELTLKKLDIDKNYVIDSIRNPHEVGALRQRPDFHLLVVEADEQQRFERVKNRGRENDPQDMREFQRLEKEELENKNPAGQQLLATAALADHIIPNNESLDTLHGHVKNLALELLRKQPRPAWDEYFMNIARVTSLRSNCVKRKVAAVIVRDQRLISTGYNGTPRGVKNCNEGGCPRCNSFGESGKGLEDCLCSHAEENAITQSAYHGVAV